MSQAEIRISDAEREAAVSALGEHYLAGRLTKEEYDERADVAWAAKTSAALRPLFVDLPLIPMAQPAVLARTPAPTRGGRSRRRRLPVFPIAMLFILVMVLTPLHLPWWGWLLLGWMWFSGMLAAMLGGWGRSRHRHGSARRGRYS